MKRSLLIILLCFLIGITAAFALSPKQTYSAAERRRLAAFPPLTLESALDGSFADGLETYFLDHFPFREPLRSVKAYFACGVLRQKENNGIYIADGYASKPEYPLNEREVLRTAELICAVKEDYFPTNRVFYTIIPDKNYFLAEQNGYPHMDYDALFSLAELSLDGTAEYIDLVPALSIDCYYQTDTHWRQERIGGVAAVLCEGLGSETAFDGSAFTWNTVGDFYGVYCGQAALPFSAEALIYLTNDVTQKAVVFDAESDSTKTVYQTQLLADEGSLDRYDIFLGGARAVLTIENPLYGGENPKRLIIFRDSFGSSLAPLLLSQYSELVLIDLRYISAGLLGEYVDFSDADILFAYNTLIWNNGSMLRE